MFFNAVSAGVYHTCGLTTGGAIYCWGNNRAGELGNGAVSYVNSSPVLVSGESSFVAIAAGYQYSCGLTTGGAAYCWGDNASGQLGNGNSTSSGVPVPVAGGLNFMALSAGYFHACGLTRDGAAYCWGDNSVGELGDGSTKGPASARSERQQACAAARFARSPPRHPPTHTSRCGLAARSDRALRALAKNCRPTPLRHYRLHEILVDLVETVC